MYIHHLAVEGKGFPIKAATDLRVDVRREKEALLLNVETDKGMLAARCSPSDEFPCYLPSQSVFAWPGLAYTFYNDVRFAFALDVHERRIHTVELSERNSEIDVWPLKYLEVDHLDLNGWGLNKVEWERYSTLEPAYVVNSLNKKMRRVNSKSLALESRWSDRPLVWQEPNSW